jgi:hypothetical protein
VQLLYIESQHVAYLGGTSDPVYGWGYVAPTPTVQAVTEMGE